MLVEPKFYMTSYIVYLLVVQCPNFLGLTKKGNMQELRAWPYIVYPQLVQKKLREKRPKFSIFYDAFIFANIRFLEGDYVKRMSIEATNRVKELGDIFL